MTGRHAAADDVDDEARAQAEPDQHGAHRAEDATPTDRPVPPRTSGRHRGSRSAD